MCENTVIRSLFFSFYVVYRYLLDEKIFSVNTHKVTQQDIVVVNGELFAFMYVS